MPGLGACPIPALVPLVNKHALAFKCVLALRGALATLACVTKYLSTSANSQLPALAVARAGGRVRPTGSDLGSTFCGKNSVSVGSQSGQHAVFSGAYSYRAAVCLHAAHIAALREFWTDWPPWHGNTVLTVNHRPKAQTCRQAHAPAARCLARSVARVRERSGEEASCQNSKQRAINAL